MGDQQSSSAHLLAKRKARTISAATGDTPAHSDTRDPAQEGSDVYVPSGQDSDSDLVSLEPGQSPNALKRGPDIILRDSSDSDGPKKKKGPVKKKQKKEAVVLDPDRCV